MLLTRDQWFFNNCFGLRPTTRSHGKCQLYTIMMSHLVCSVANPCNELNPYVRCGTWHRWQWLLELILSIFQVNCTRGKSHLVYFDFLPNTSVTSRAVCARLNVPLSVSTSNRMELLCYFSLVRDAVASNVVSTPAGHIGAVPFHPELWLYLSGHTYWIKIACLFFYLYC